MFNNLFFTFFLYNFALVNKIKMDEIKKYYLDEIMKLEPDNETINYEALKILNSYVKVELLMNDKFNTYYICSVEDILNSDISNEELIQIRNNGWQYSDDKKSLIKNL